MSEQKKGTVATAKVSLLGKEDFLAQLQVFLDENIAGNWCVVAIDIEHFNLFNEWYGRDCGDKLLEDLGDCIQKIGTNEKCPVGYFGNDDFFVVAPNDNHCIDHLYTSLQKCLLDRIGPGNMTFFIVLGLCTVDPGNSSAQSLCNYASIALTSRTPGSSYICRFEPSMLEKHRRHQQLLAEVSLGLERHEFCFFLQPKCNSMTHRIIGMEALARWKHPQRGFVPPGEFIPLMEHTGLITKLDLQIWESVCQLLHRWQQEKQKFVPISVNVSIADISVLNIAQVFSDLLEKYQLEPKFISIEITESMMAQNISIVQNTILALHRRGFTVLMDDFGSGYSSLNMLKDTSVDILKLDMKFVDLTPDNREKGIQIVESVIGMAHRLNMPVIAEGVETQEQMYMLQSMDCLYTQGYYFYKPMPVEEVEQLLNSRPSTETYWDWHRDLMMRDHRVFGGNHVSEQTAVALQAYQIVSDNVMELSRLNLMTGEYRVVARSPALPGGAMEDVRTFEEYCQRMISIGAIGQDYARQFLQLTNLELLRKVLFTAQKPLSSRFRGANKDRTPSPLIASILPCQNCSEAEPWAAILILNLPET